MKFTVGKATLAIMLLLSAGFIFTLIVSADTQKSVPLDDEHFMPVATSWSLPATTRAFWISRTR